MPDGNGNNPKAFTRSEQTLIPSGTGVVEGEAPQLGKGAILLLLTQDTRTNVFMAPEDAIREGEALAAMGRRLKSGLHIAGERDVGPIARAAQETNQMKGEE